MSRGEPVSIPATPQTADTSRHHQLFGDVPWSKHVKSFTGKRKLTERIRHSGSKIRTSTI